MMAAWIARLASYPGFNAMFDRTSAWEACSPLTWDANDPEPVADAVCFLFSDLARAVMGGILHVDGGYHAMAANLNRPT